MDGTTNSSFQNKNPEKELLNSIFKEGPQNAVTKYTLHFFNQKEGYEKFVKYLILEKCRPQNISKWLYWLCLGYVIDLFVDSFVR
jgi:hypothetical protein